MFVRASALKLGVTLAKEYWIEKEKNAYNIFKSDLVRYKKWEVCFVSYDNVETSIINLQAGTCDLFHSDISR
jgi:hypothetical protein